MLTIRVFATIGKIFGLENNYYVAEVDYREGGLEEEEEEEEVEMIAQILVRECHVLWCIS